MKSTSLDTKYPGREQRARKNLIPVDSGYHYNDDNHQEMADYHMDASHIFQDRMSKETKFRGRLSVRLDKETIPLLMFGHEESIFNQFLLTK